MFLKKLKVKQSEALQIKIADIQQNIKKQFNYADKIEAWEKEKDKKTKNLTGFVNPTPTLSLAEIKKTDEYKTWKEELNTTYNDLQNDLKEQMQEAYLQAKQTQLPDYKIFMAIAEEIGYDATGKIIERNELDIISEELESFINQIENGKI